MSKSRREIGRRNKKEYKGGRRREGDDIRKPTHTLDISLKHLNFVLSFVVFDLVSFLKLVVRYFHQFNLFC